MTEDEHQESIFDWASSNLGKYPELEYMYANMNGARRSKRYTAKLKLRGLKSGIPDIFLPVARWGFHGLYIELKRPKSKGKAAGRTSANQKRWIKHLIDLGFAVHICFGSTSAIETIEYYLE